MDQQKAATPISSSELYYCLPIYAIHIEYIIHTQRRHCTDTTCKAHHRNLA